MNEPQFEINADACGRCGMSGLEMLGRGELKRHICDPARVEKYQRDKAWRLWRWQAQEMV
jgi:hypothetical protein